MAKRKGNFVAPNKDTLTEQVVLDRLGLLASRVPFGQAIVELGVFRGGSLKVLADNAPKGVAVFGIDAFGEPKAGMKMRPNLEMARRLAPTAHLLKGDTVSFGENWMGPDIGLLYIDADHSGAGVRRDWETWRGHLAEGAWVAFDDYALRWDDKLAFPDLRAYVDSLGFEVEVIGKTAFVFPW